MTKLVFKQAETPAEMKQIHELNHRVFAEEIRQHPTQTSGALVDRFHMQNRYFVAERGGRVVGMISAHEGPEFSVTKRLPNPRLLESFERPLEVRLLAIDSAERRGPIAMGLFATLLDFALSSGFSHLLISGIVAQQTIYRKLGFRPLGPAVRDGAAEFVPMVVSPGEQVRLQRRRADRLRRKLDEYRAPVEPVSLLPGPVCIHSRVAHAMAAPAVSHRSPAFVDAFETVRARLCGLAPGMEVAVFPGAGTLANDMVGANLRAAFGDGEGLVLANGEFGERIARQAAAAGLKFQTLRYDWHEPWSMGELRGAFARKPLWVWAVHVETSTGVLNDVETLVYLARQAGTAVALDCVSSMGAVAVPAAQGGPLMVSGVSGKALGSYAGLAFVFANLGWKNLLRDKVLCPSFDVVRMLEMRGPLTTVPSPMLFALANALDQRYGSGAAVEQRFRDYAAMGRYVRRELRAVGLIPLAAEADSAPHVTTFIMEQGLSEVCLRAGYRMAFESGYLLDRGWGQVATMGEISIGSLEPLFAALKGVEWRDLPAASGDVSGDVVEGGGVAVEHFSGDLVGALTGDLAISQHAGKGQA